MEALIYFLIYAAVAALLVWLILYVTKAPINVRTIVWVVYGVIVLLFFLKSHLL